MADHPLREGTLEERQHEIEHIRSLEPDYVANLKHGIVREAYELFLTHFGPSSINDLKAAIAPGRVNLIGDHVDYCDGFVLPMVGEQSIDMYKIFISNVINFSKVSKAIPLYTAVVGRPANDQCRGFTNVFSSYFEDPITFYSDPLPSGVKSAELCQRVEHEFLNVPCGIMDQFVISFAEYAHALRIDCRSLTFDLIPMSISHDALFLIINSGVHHTHSGGEYAKRRKTVEKALSIEKYRVSCPELDELVSLVLSCDGVFGSRMTGGGFGGCTVSLVRKDNVDAVKNYVKVYYFHLTLVLKVR
ncbi:unnamed protein product [Angiostrongylus costaricensis]|uniref:Galactokinase n=1 Tax=Angiostrongylus costaricensis TaxID=334426 RepID=A0A158PDV2_ANGCS|nr:unnamed protein product [Angiostrongylus costaricensis]